LYISNTIKYVWFKSYYQDLAIHVKFIVERDKTFYTSLKLRGCSEKGLAQYRSNLQHANGSHVLETNATVYNRWTRVGNKIFYQFRPKTPF